jgi:hypothetical protein
MVCLGISAKKKKVTDIKVRSQGGGMLKVKKCRREFFLSQQISISSGNRNSARYFHASGQNLSNSLCWL